VSVLYYIVADSTPQPPFSHPCIENVGHMGKEQTDTCIPSLLVSRTVETLHIPHISTDSWLKVCAAPGMAIIERDLDTSVGAWFGSPLELQFNALVGVK